MISATNAILVAAAAILVPSLALRTQSAAPQGGAQDAARDYCSMTGVLGATVRIQPGDKTRREAKEDGNAPKGPEGKIEEVLVDAHNGVLEYAVVSFGGFAGIGDKTVAVPFTVLAWKPSHERFDLDASEDRLAGLPAFDLAKAREAGLDLSVDGLRGKWTDANSGGQPPQPAPQADQAPEKKPDTSPAAKALAGTPFFMIPTRFVCASEIDDFAVHTASEQFGSISDLIVDRGRHALELVVVHRGSVLGVGGTQYLVPYRALLPCTSGDKRMHCVGCDTTKLEAAVVYEKPTAGVVDADAARRALADRTFESGSAAGDAKGR